MHVQFPWSKPILVSRSCSRTCCSAEPSVDLAAHGLLEAVFVVAVVALGEQVVGVDHRIDRDVEAEREVGDLGRKCDAASRLDGPRHGRLVHEHATRIGVAREVVHDHVGGGRRAIVEDGGLHGG